MSRPIARSSQPLGLVARSDLPNPYRLVEHVFKLAEGRWWGPATAIDIDVDGRSVWVADRCGGARCTGSPLNPILKFDATGRLLRRFGERLFAVPHGIHVDRDGNVWVTDTGSPDGPDGQHDGQGHVVYKFSPDGRVLLVLGRPGVAGDGRGALLNGPSDVVTGPEGEIFVADGHGGDDPAAPPTTVARIAKFRRDGRFLASWGRLGSAPGEFRTPHGLALDSQGRLFVADRGNTRIQIFDREGRFLAEWRQFGRVSGLFIDRRDLLYAADAWASEVVDPRWRPGIRVGSARDGRLLAFIPERADGVAVDAAGTIYAVAVEGSALGPKTFVPEVPVGAGPRP